MRAIVVVISALLGLSCTSAEPCTEIGCTDDATVTFPTGTVSGPYDLSIETGAGTLDARCADPGSPESLDNPPDLTCTLSGFGLEGVHAQGHSIRVTVTPVGMDPVAEGTEVLLSAVDEFQPNGEGCPPTCFTRAGELLM